MKDTFNNVLTKLIVLVMIAFLMFGEYVVLKIYFSDHISPSGNGASAEESVNNAQVSSIFQGENSDVISDMVEKVGSGVVNIETTVVTQSSDNPLFNDPFFRQFFGNPFGNGEQEYVQSGLGTGFIISEDGYIVTNQHVIEDATEIQVTITGNSEPYPATVIGEDHDLDLAVIKIEANEELTPLALGDSSDIRVGEWVTAIGNPYGLDHTVTVGVISATGRPVTIDDRTYKDLIQTDAAINPGNSGGPLLNLAGEVVGINTAVNSQAQGIGFAISINTAKEVLDQLITEGRVIRPYIGITMQNFNEEMAAYLEMNFQRNGVIVAEVVNGSPAQDAGVQPYDIIVGMDDEMIEDMDQLQDYLATKQVGDEIQLHILRGEEEISLSLTLEERP